MKVQLGASFQLENFYGVDYKFNSFSVSAEVDGPPNEGEDNFECHSRLRDECEILFQKNIHAHADLAKRIIDEARAEGRKRAARVHGEDD